MRPKIKLKMDKADAAIELISAVSVFTTLYFFFTQYSNLPETIPTHFDFAGNADSYGNKNSIVVPIIVMMIIYLGFTLLAKIPHIYNYAVEITIENAEQQYKAAVRFMRILKLEMTLLFSYIAVFILNLSTKSNSGIGVWVLPAALIIIFATVGIYLVKSFRLNKTLLLK